LDEPFAGVDPIAVNEIQKIIEQLKTRGIGVSITDHKVRETLSICERAYIISDGTIIKQGSPHEIAADPLVKATYLGENFELN
jgi:lipopolysaccharide export system ATP-binding protein